MPPVAIRESPLLCAQPRTRKTVCTQMNGHHLPHNRLNTNHFPVLQIESNPQLFFFHALGHHLAKVGVGCNTGSPSTPPVAKNSCFFNSLRTLSHFLLNRFGVDLPQVQQPTGFLASRAGGIRNAQGNRSAGVCFSWQVLGVQSESTSPVSEKRFSVFGFRFSVFGFRFSVFEFRVSCFPFPVSCFPFSLFYFLFSASQLFGNSDEHFRRILR
jgi:hypothetical protein